MNILLNVKQLSFIIGKKTVSKPFNWQVLPGDIWGILGPNGCGKTSLLHTLAGLKKYSAGEIFLLEQRLAEMSAKKIAQHLGILLQDTETGFSQTVFEFCLSGRFPHSSFLGLEQRDDKEIVMRALEFLSLQNQLAQKVQTLSGGEKRRLAIATVLAQTPKLYLLDEPTNHLDIRYQIHVLQLFKQQAEMNQAGVVMVLHDLHLVKQFCNKICLMFANGEIMQGNTDDLLIEDHISRLYQHRFQTQADASLFPVV